MAAVHATVVVGELGEGHLGAHRGVVQVRVEHHQRKGADVGRVCIDEGARGVAVERGSKGLHDAIDLLRLARHVQRAEDETQRLERGDN